MTDRDIIERVASLFDRAIVPVRPRKAHYKVPYATVIKGAEAIDLMTAVRPFLSPVRQRQIDRAIASRDLNAMMIRGFAVARRPISALHQRRRESAASIISIPFWT